MLKACLTHLVERVDVSLLLDQQPHRLQVRTTQRIHDGGVPVLRKGANVSVRCGAPDHAMP
jgi:hypothetical protein